MITAVDTSVLLDLLTDDSRFGSPSEQALRSARKQGRLIVCETVIAEISPTLASREQMLQFLNDLNIEFVPSTLPSSLLAGEMYRRYLANRGSAKRVLPDFLVGAHAMLFAEALLTRDRGYYREYFSELTILNP